MGLIFYGYHFWRGSSHHFPYHLVFFVVPKVCFFKKGQQVKPKIWGSKGLFFVALRCLFLKEKLPSPKMLGCKRGWPLQKETSENGFTTMPSRAMLLGGGNSNMFGMFIPIWGRFPIWRSYFSEWLKPPTRLDEEKFWEGNKNDSHFCCFEPWFFKWATRKAFAWLVWVL